MAVISSIQIDTSSASKSIADLEKELQETNEQLKQVDINSDAFKELQKKAANAKGQLDSINQTTDALSKGFQGFGENLAKVTGGISGGITAATAAMQLMGVENENVMEGIAKLQQLMAFTQGISGLKDLGSGFKGLLPTLKSVVGGLNGVKGALIGTGIGAAVVAIGLLIANWDKLTKALNDFIGVGEDVNVVTAAFSGALEGLKQTAVAVGNAVVQYIKTPFESVIKGFQKFANTDGSIWEKLKAGVKAGTKVVKDNAQDVVDEFKEIGEKSAEAYNNSINEQNAKAEAERKAEEERKHQEEIAAAEKKAKEVEEARQKARKKAQDAYNEVEIALQIEEEKNKRLVLSDEERYKRQLDIDQRRLENIKKLYGEDSLEYQKYLTTIYNLSKEYQDKLNEENNNSNSTVPEAPDIEREEEEDDGWADKVTAAQEYYKFINEQELGADAQFRAIQDEKRQKLEEFYKQGLITAEQYNKSTAKLDKEEKMHKVQMYSQAATGIADILSSLSSTMDQNNEKQFKAMKAMQIASATIQMMVGITTALSGTFTTKSGPWDIALAVIQATSIAASGAAQIANIAKQKYNGNNGSSSASAATASLSSAAASITTPQQYSTAVEGAEIESSISDSKVYVVESDIQAVGNKVNVQETENRY